MSSGSEGILVSVTVSLTFVTGPLLGLTCGTATVTAVSLGVYSDPAQEVQSSRLTPWPVQPNSDMIGTAF